MKSTMVFTSCRNTDDAIARTTAWYESRGYVLDEERRYEWAPTCVFLVFRLPDREYPLLDFVPDRENQP